MKNRDKLQVGHYKQYKLGQRKDSTYTLYEQEYSGWKLLTGSFQTQA